MTSATKTEKRDTYDLSDYEKWLSKQGYQPSTMIVTLRNLRTIAAEGKIPAEAVEPHVRRYLRFVLETKKNPLGRDFIAKMKKAGIEPSADTEKMGRRSKKLLDLKSWSGLKAKLRRGEETDLLIAAYMNSGLRIAAFLALKADKVTDEHTDAVSRKWIKKQGGSKPLYKLLCETERCAYARMLRRLQEVAGEKVDLDTLYKTQQKRAAAEIAESGEAAE